ncbi:hypothetical protein A2U01_0058593, partial [Trifolium medium]|nr:hypothetical protein [Trifolium medium]
EYRPLDAPDAHPDSQTFNCAPPDFQIFNSLLQQRHFNAIAIIVQPPPHTNPILDRALPTPEP